MEQLDETDRRILRKLRRDGRLSNTKLAEKVGLSTTPCWNRVRALEEGGVIEGYTALLNQEALGLPDTVIIEVTLERHDDAMLEKFGRALALLPEVMEAYLLTGEYDYLIKVAVEAAGRASDPPEAVAGVGVGPCANASDGTSRARGRARSDSRSWTRTRTAR